MTATRSLLGRRGRHLPR